MLIITYFVAIKHFISNNYLGDNTGGARVESIFLLLPSIFILFIQRIESNPERKLPTELVAKKNGKKSNQ